MQQYSPMQSNKSSLGFKNHQQVQNNIN